MTEGLLYKKILHVGNHDLWLDEKTQEKAKKVLDEAKQDFTRLIFSKYRNKPLYPSAKMYFAYQDALKKRVKKWFGDGEK